MNGCVSQARVTCVAAYFLGVFGATPLRESQIRSVVRASGPPRAMHADDVLALTATTDRRTLGDGEFLIRAGAEHSPLFVLESGGLSIELGGARINHVSTPGSVLGELGLLLEMGASADVRADGEVVVREVQDADRLFDDNPQFARHVATTLARRLYRVTTYLDDLQRQFADERGSLGLVSQVLGDLLRDPGDEIDAGSEREADSPY